MPLSYILAGIAVIMVMAHVAGSAVARVRHRAAPAGTKMHSVPGYYGSYLALCVGLPALFAIILWSLISPFVVSTLIQGELPSSVLGKSAAERTLVVSRIDAVARGLAKLSGAELREVERASTDLSAIENAQKLLQAQGVVFGASPQPFVIKAAFSHIAYSKFSDYGRGWLAALLMIVGFAIGWLHIKPRMRARIHVERAMLGLLMLASCVAILTTLGIVLSVLFETLHFFQLSSWKDFLFGTVWDPRFSAAGRDGGDAGQFGLIPLLWGTLFISFVALAVAVPVGLMAAIYMAEYASKGFRNKVKPVLEILAGIPTIVYGFFALVTLGPFLRDVGAAIDLTVSASSVLTAGIVMGVMIIPYVSSLSDDIITAVPQSLREGSLGLGATKSETITRVVLPAALPGIVGAILLAASRAIGETMIVVLAAGIAARLTLNPFEPVTTITVKIVS